MKNKIKVFLFLAVNFLWIANLNAQHFLKAHGKKIVNENNEEILLRGMGLGGWMVQEGYMLQTAGFANPQHEIKASIQALIGEENTKVFYEKWLANHVTKTDIDSLKSWGFNSVRLPMHYNLFTLPIEEEPISGENTWLTTGFELTDSLLSWCKQNEMYVILDLHAAPGGQGSDEGISDYDTDKPSLWESEENRNKMVALWGKLAERYKEEQWVAGYDLLNEPNWDLPGGVALRDLYEKVTVAIRAVDTKHILFIEGNWFANDFTGLTPPWDENMVYSPHKYWSFNDKATIQSFLDLRDNHNVPLYLGESGENSNVWFRDAIRLLEELEIGWAWWPMKKIESIAGPLAVIKTPAYQSLLDYWSGTGSKPTSDVATNTLMEIAEGLKIENCVYQKDVIDAMFRQVYSDEILPFKTPQKIPGIVYATDFNMGVIGEAYYDNESANYQVSSGTYTSWNNGWSYRNDAIDIEKSSDNVNTNGYNVGWVATDEWMKYSIDVEKSGVYNINLRVASGASGGALHFEIGNSSITSSVTTPTTEGWQNWQTVTISNVYLDKSDKELKFYCDQEGFNLSSFEFVATGIDVATLPTEFVDAITLDEYSIQMNINKFISNSSTLNLGDFEVFVNDTKVSLTAIAIEDSDNRIINFEVDRLLKSSDVITLSYLGNLVMSADGRALDSFTKKEVKNNLKFVHDIPSRIQAEDYFFQSGVALETTTDTGGGQNIGFLDPGDYLDYEINISVAGSYLVEYRTASELADGEIEVQLIDKDGITTVISTPSFTITGGWQTWTTSSEIVDLPAGRYVMRILITKAPFNMNWINFSISTSLTEESDFASNSLEIFPNPSNDIFNLQFNIEKPQDALLKIYNTQGKIVLTEELKKVSKNQNQISLKGLSEGIYILKIELENGDKFSRKIVKY